MSIETINHSLSAQIKSADDFNRLTVPKGQSIFARIVGDSEMLRQAISQLDKTLLRIDTLPILSSASDADRYIAVYEQWQQSSCSLPIDIEITEGNTLLAAKLSEICCDLLAKFRELRPNATPSVEKNFIVMLLYRLDKVFAGSAPDAGIKLVGTNAEKPPEYLFFYAAALLGTNVLIMQTPDAAGKFPEIINAQAAAAAPALTVNKGNRDTVQNVATPIMPDIFAGDETVLLEDEPPASTYNIESDETILMEPDISSADTIRRDTPSPLPHSQQPIGNIDSADTIKIIVPPRKRKSAPAADTVRDIPYEPTLQLETPFGNEETVLLEDEPPTAPINAPQRNNMPIQRPASSSFTPISRPENISYTPIERPSADAAMNFKPIRRQTSISADRYRRSKPELSYEQLAALASSVVQILVIESAADIRPNGEFKACASGSGVMIGSGGYIVTNCHVAGRGKIYAVRIENDNRFYFTDRLVKYHNDYDLAVLKIDRKLDPLPIYNGQIPLARGQKVFAIGSPLGMFNTVSDGIISGFRSVNGVDMIQFTAPISEGSSGGALLNMYGDVIGISTAGIESDRSVAQNLNLAVSYETIRSFCGGMIG